MQFQHMAHLLILASVEPQQAASGFFPRMFNLIASLVHEMPHAMDYALTDGTIRRGIPNLLTYYSDSVCQSIEMDLLGRFLEQRLYGGFVEVRYSSIREVCQSQRIRLLCNRLRPLLQSGGGILLVIWLSRIQVGMPYLVSDDGTTDRITEPTIFSFINGGRSHFVFNSFHKSWWPGNFHFIKYHKGLGTCRRTLLTTIGQYHNSHSPRWVIPSEG